MAKATFNKKKSLFDCKLDLNLRNKLIACYYRWSIDLYVAELCKLRKKDQKYLTSFEMFCWRRIEFSLAYTVKNNKEFIQSKRVRSSDIKSEEVRQPGCVTSCIGSGF